MSFLPPPWSGLFTFAPRVDLSPVIAALGGPSAAASAPPDAWLPAGLPPRLLARLTAPPVEGAWLHPDHPSWPTALRGVPYGPVALSWRGRLELLQRPAVAVVGARACTRYGQQWATRIAKGVRDAGGVIVSGLAAGIDLAAHRGALDATIAVLGQGLGPPLPAWQQRLHDDILHAGGLILSEFPPQQSPDRWTFPIRNRIIAGLARVVVVVEAAQRSGSRITAEQALACGRDVLAVPGPIDAPASAGCLDLIADGATMVRDVQTVLHAAGLTAPSAAALRQQGEAEILSMLRDAR